MSNSLTNYAVSPGEYIEEWMEDNYLTVEKLSEEMGVSCDELKSLISGKPAPMTLSLAVGLFEATGVKVDHWLRIEELYRSDLKRLNLNR